MDRSRLIREIIQKGISFQAEKLKVIKELGRGGNGVAFQCINALGETVVAKIYIPPDNRDLDSQSLARFEREIKLSTTLRSEEHTSELQSRLHLVCRLLLEK